MKAIGTITIVGAGMAGSLLAVLLRRRGHDVAVFERRPDSRLTGAYGGRSINLALSHRGLRALARAGLESKALELAIPMRGRMLHGHDGATRLQPYSPTPDEYINSISRSALNELLLDEAERAGARIEFEQRCDGFNPETGILRFEDRNGRFTMHEADVVIGADGVSSAVRLAMEDAGYSSSTIDQLDHGYKELEIPPGPDNSHLLEPEALHIWPRRSFMLIALPNLSGSFTGTLFLAYEGHPSFRELDEGKSTVTKFFEREFADVVPLISDLEGQFRAHPTSYLQTVRCDSWRVGGRVLLIGDAAHAIVPFYGQGMNCAFEDCRILDEMLEDAGNSGVETVFAEFEKLRKPDADAIAELALVNFIEMRDKVAEPRFLFQKEVEAELARRFPDSYTPIYSNVTFSSIRYSEALRRARIQQEFLHEIMAGRKSVAEIDWDAAEDLLQSVSSHAESED